MAIRFAASHKMSEGRAARYKSYIHRYLQKLQELHPHMRLRPNHHLALHFDSFLRMYGPVHGWWMFPFERVIGILQKTNTNWKVGECIIPFPGVFHSTSPGEMEATMLESFCAAGNIKLFVSREACPEALRKCAPILDDYTNGEDRGTLNSDVRDFLANSGIARAARNDKVPTKRPTNLDDAIVATLESQSFALAIELPGWVPDHQGIKLTSYIRGNLHLSVASHCTANSVVFFIPTPETGETIPGIIREMFQQDQYVFFVLQRYLPAEIEDPFQEYIDFGAALWSKRLRTEPEVIPASRVAHQGYRRPWGTNHLVLKPIIKVRFVCVALCINTYADAGFLTLMLVNCTQLKKWGYITSWE